MESVVDLYGPTDLVWSYEHPSNPRVYDLRARVADFVGGSPETAGDLYRLLSPAMRVTSSAPRTLIIHGGRDQIVGKHNGEILADKLHDAGVRYETLFIPYAQHGFDYVFGSIAEQIVETVLLRFLNDRPAAVTAPVVE